MQAKRSPGTRRSWLFLPGADQQQLESALACGADVLIQELEDFTPADRRPHARMISRDVLGAWNAAGVVSAVRINPLETCGRDDLEAAMQGCPDVVMMSKVASPEQVRELDRLVSALEAELGIPIGHTELVPNIETAAGLVRTSVIADGSPRVTALLVAAEDMAADLGAERTPSGGELAYVRSRFLVECVAASVLAIDCPYTYSDLYQAEVDLRYARGLGYKAKSIVNPGQVALVNLLLTPGTEDVRHATRVVQAFEAARSRGEDRVEVDGLMVEVPTYLAAHRLLKRAADLAGAT